MTVYDKADLENVMWGAAVLGGAGGNLALATHLFADIDDSSTFQVIGKSELTTTSRATTLSLLGKPVPSLLHQVGDSAIAALQMMKTTAVNDGGGALTSILPAAINPTNAVLAFAHASTLSVLDCDGAGAGASGLSLLTFVDAATLSPAWISSIDHDENHQTIAVGVPDAIGMDGMLQAVVASPPYSNYGLIAGWRLSKQNLDDLAVFGTISLCRSLGINISDGATSQTICDTLTAADRIATKLITGVSNLEAMSSPGGMDSWRLSITGDDGRVARVYGLGDNLTYWASEADSGPAKVAPVCLSLWDEANRCPVTSSELAATSGSTITVIGITPPAKLTGSTRAMSGYSARLKLVGYGGSLS